MEKTTKHWMINIVLIMVLLIAAKAVLKEYYTPVKWILIAILLPIYGPRIWKWGKNTYTMFKTNRDELILKALKKLKSWAEWANKNFNGVNINIAENVDDEELKSEVKEIVESAKSTVDDVKESLMETLGDVREAIGDIISETLWDFGAKKNRRPAGRKPAPQPRPGPRPPRPTPERNSFSSTVSGTSFSGTTRSINDLTFKEYNRQKIRENNVQPGDILKIKMTNPFQHMFGDPIGVIHGDGMVTSRRWDDVVVIDVRCTDDRGPRDSFVTRTDMDNLMILGITKKPRVEPHMEPF